MSPILWVGSPKFTAGHPAPLIALVHHRMVGTLRSTDAVFTSTDGREASTHFGVGCGPAGHPPGSPVRAARRLGADFEFAVWALSYGGWIPAAGILPRPEDNRPGRPTAMIGAHLVYGVVLGTLDDWRRSNETP